MVQDRLPFTSIYFCASGEFSIFRLCKLAYPLKYLLQQTFYFLQYFSCFPKLHSKVFISRKYRIRLWIIYQGRLDKLCQYQKHTVNTRPRTMRTSLEYLNGKIYIILSVEESVTHVRKENDNEIPVVVTNCCLVDKKRLNSSLSTETVEYHIELWFYHGRWWKMIIQIFISTNVK